MYIGKPKLSSLRAFIDGYTFRISNTDEQLEFLEDFPGFHKWVARKYGYQKYSVGYPEVILAVTTNCAPDSVLWDNYDKNLSDEVHSKSVEMFFDLIKEYRKKIEQK